MVGQSSWFKKLCVIKAVMYRMKSSFQ